MEEQDGRFCAGPSGPAEPGADGPAYRLEQLDARAAELRWAMEELAEDLEFYFPALRPEQRMEAEDLLRGFYQTELAENRREQDWLREQSGRGGTRLP